MLPIEFDIIVFKDRKNFISYSPELDVSSCGMTVEEAEKMGTLEDILIESGYQKDNTNNWIAPRLVATEIAVID